MEQVGECFSFRTGILELAQSHDTRWTGCTPYLFRPPYDATYAAEAALHKDVLHVLHDFNPTSSVSHSSELDAYATPPSEQGHLMTCTLYINCKGQNRKEVYMYAELLSLACALSNIVKRTVQHYKAFCMERSREVYQSKALLAFNKDVWTFTLLVGP